MASYQQQNRLTAYANSADHLLKLFNGDLAVKISFESKHIREICESQVKAERIYGLEVARQIRGFLADLDSAETLAEVPPEVYSVSNDSLFEGFEAMLAGGMLLRMQANHAVFDRLTAGQIDRDSVRRLKILEIKKIEVGRG